MVGCDTASVYFVSSKKYNLSEGVIYTLILGGIGAVLAFLLGFSVMQLEWSFFEKAPKDSFYLAMIMVPTSLFAMTFTRLLTATKAYKWFAIMTLFQTIMQLIFTLLFVWFLDLGVNGGIYALIASSLLTCVALFIYFRKQQLLYWVKPEYGKLVAMISYGIRFYIGKISNLVNVQVGTIILAFQMSEVEVGIFSVAVSLTTMVMIFPDSLGIVMVEKSAGDKDGKKDAIAYVARLTFIVCSTGLLILAIFANQIVTILFSSAFQPAVPLVRILCIGVIIRSVCKVFVPYLLGINRPGVASISVAIGTVTNILMLWFLLPRIGIAGAAVGTVISYMVGSIFLLYAFIKFSGLGITEIFRYTKNDYKPIEKIVNKFKVNKLPRKKL